jgi:hypothetical protein
MALANTLAYGDMASIIAVKRSQGIFIEALYLVIFYEYSSGSATPLTSIFIELLELVIFYEYSGTPLTSVFIEPLELVIFYEYSVTPLSSIFRASHIL